MVEDQRLLLLHLHLFLHLLLVAVCVDLGVVQSEEGGDDSGLTLPTSTAPPSSAIVCTNNHHLRVKVSYVQARLLEDALLCREQKL